MNGSACTVPFFNRLHLVQGAQVLANVLCMLGVIFAGLDQLHLGRVRPLSLLWSGAALCLSGLTWALVRRLRAALAPLAAGAGVGIFFLVIVWVLSRSVT